jgi:hypothetical protein
MAGIPSLDGFDLDRGVEDSAGAGDRNSNDEDSFASAARSVAPPEQLGLRDAPADTPVLPPALHDLPTEIVQHIAGMMPPYARLLSYAPTARYAQAVVKSDPTYGTTLDGVHAAAKVVGKMAPSVRNNPVLALRTLDKHLEYINPVLSDELIAGAVRSELDRSHPGAIGQAARRWLPLSGDQQDTLLSAAIGIEDSRHRAFVLRAIGYNSLANLSDSQQTRWAAAVTGLTADQRVAVSSELLPKLHDKARSQLLEAISQEPANTPPNAGSRVLAASTTLPLTSPPGGPVRE